MRVRYRATTAQIGARPSGRQPTGYKVGPSPPRSGSREIAVLWIAFERCSSGAGLSGVTAVMGRLCASFVYMEFSLFRETGTEQEPNGTPKLFEQ